MSDDLSHQILKSAAEDAFGLYEVLWEMRTIHPDQPDEERRETAAKAIKALAERGWIKLVKRPWQVDARTNDALSPVPKDQWESVLSDPDNWKVPRWNLHIAVVTTSEGYRAISNKS